MNEIKNWKTTRWLLDIVLIMIIGSLIYYISPIFVKVFNIVLNIFIPFAIALVLALATYPLIQYFRQRFKWKNSKAKLLSIVLVLLLLVGFVLLFIPLLVEVINSSIPALTKIYETNIEPLLSSNDFNISKVLKYINISGTVMSLAQIVTILLLIIIIYLFMIFDIERIRIFIKSIVINSKKQRFIDFAWKFDENFDSYLKAMIVYCGIAMIYYSIGTLLISMFWTWPDITSFKWYLYGLIYGILVIIPYIGPTLGTVIISLSMLKYGTTAAIIMFVGVIILNQIDGNLIQIRIIGSKMKVHPLLVIFTLSVASAIFGISGVLLSPILLILNKTIIDIYKEDFKEFTHTNEDGHAKFAIQEIESLREDGKI